MSKQPKPLTAAQEQKARDLFASTGLDIRTIRAYLRGESVMPASKRLIELQTKTTKA